MSFCHLHEASLRGTFSQPFLHSELLLLHKICELNPSAADIDMLWSIQFHNSQEVLNDLKTKSPAHSAAIQRTLHLKLTHFIGGRHTSQHYCNGQKLLERFCCSDHHLQLWNVHFPFSITLFQVVKTHLWKRCNLHS